MTCPQPHFAGLRRGFMSCTFRSREHTHHGSQFFDSERCMYIFIPTKPGNTDVLGQHQGWNICSGLLVSNMAPDRVGCSTPYSRRRFVQCSMSVLTPRVPMTSKNLQPCTVIHLGSVLAERCGASSAHSPPLILLPNPWMMSFSPSACSL